MLKNKIKSLAINSAKEMEDLWSKNYKMLIKYIKKDTNASRFMDWKK